MAARAFWQHSGDCNVTRLTDGYLIYWNDRLV